MNSYGVMFGYGLGLATAFGAWVIHRCRQQYDWGPRSQIHGIGRHGAERFPNG